MGRDQGEPPEWLVAIFEEDDISASKFSTKPRPVWDRMLELIRAGSVHTVMSTESERLLRKPKDMDYLIVAAETTALRELCFTSDDSIDLSTPEGIYRAHQRKRYAGIREHKGAEYPAEWEPVFDPGTWEKLQFEIRRRREMKGAGKAARSYLLTGLAYYGKCGGRLNGESTRDRPGAPKRRIYYCRGTRSRDLEGEVGCGGVRRNAEALDLYITEKMFFRLDSAEIEDLLAGEGQPDDTRLRELLHQRKVIVHRITVNPISRKPLFGSTGMRFDPSAIDVGWRV